MAIRYYRNHNILRKIEARSDTADSEKIISQLKLSTTKQGIFSFEH